MDWELYVALSLSAAAFLALVGTNAQARLSKQRLLADEDTLVAEAGRLWRPGPRWLYRDWPRRSEVEAKLKEDPERAKRYDRLSTELFAWNALESSVALALPASVIAVIALLPD